MKVPALRRGNHTLGVELYEIFRLNESPRPKAGKCEDIRAVSIFHKCLNESPRPKAGKFQLRKRGTNRGVISLNESPRPKAGKSLRV